MATGSDNSSVFSNPDQILGNAYDKRLRSRALESGRLKLADLKGHLSGLEDMSGNAETVVVDAASSTSDLSND